VKLFLYGAFGTALGLFAEGETAIPDGWSSLSALGIVGVVLIFIVTKLIPDMHKKSVEQTQIFAETIKAVHSVFAEALNKIHARSEEWEIEHQKVLTGLSESLMALATQCERRGTATLSSAVDGR